MNLQPLLKQLETYIEGCVTQPSMQMQHLSGAGATYQFEQKLCCHFSKRYAVAYCNATSALLALTVAMEIKRGEIISTPFTWGGSISPFLLFGSKIVFGAVEDDTYNLDPNKLFAALSSKTKLVLSTDFNGIPANSKTIKDFCTQHGLFYISDSAQSLGAARDKYPAGFFADATVLSFSPGKSFFGGEGGAVVTDNAELHEKLIWYSQHPARQKKMFGLNGYNEYSPLNGRLNPLAAILLNDMFDHYKKKTVAYQSQCFDMVCQLKNEGLIIASEQLQESDSSTYFNLMFRISEKVKVNEIEFYLKTNRLPFQVEMVKPNCIPFDKSFRGQFAKGYAVSPGLKKQWEVIKTNEWIKITLKK